METRKIARSFGITVMAFISVFAGNKYPMISNCKIGKSVDDGLKPYKITLLDVQEKDEDCVECLEINNASLDNNEALTISLDRYNNSSSDLLHAFSELTFVPEHSTFINLDEVLIIATLFSSNN